MNILALNGHVPLYPKLDGMQCCRHSPCRNNETMVYDFACARTRHSEMHNCAVSIVEFLHHIY